MKRSQVDDTLRLMEHVRELSYEAETQAKERKLTNDYARMMASIKPYLDGTLKFEDE